MSIQNNKKAEKLTRFLCFLLSKISKTFSKLLFLVVLTYFNVVFGGFISFVGI